MEEKILKIKKEIEEHARLYVQDYIDEAKNQMKENLFTDFTLGLELEDYQEEYLKSEIDYIVEDNF